RVHLRNLSKKVTIRLADGTLIKPECELAAPLPARLQIGDTLIEIEPKNPDESAVDPASLKTIQPPLAAGSYGQILAPQVGTAPGSGELARWFEALVGVQRAAASSPDFFADTARAVVELIGLDSGLVLLRQNDDWSPLACYPPNDNSGSQFSRGIL